MSQIDHSIGVNFHSDYTQDDDYSKMLTRWKKFPPYGVLVLDSFGHKNHESRNKTINRTFQIAASLPKVTICYRMFIENPMNQTGDNHQMIMPDGRMVLTPEQWVAEHAPFANTSIFCVANNEPNFSQSIPWLLKLAKLARAAKIRVSLGGWSVGAYQVDEIPLLRQLLLYMAQNPGWFMLDLHEYVRGTWTVNFAPHDHNPANWPKRIGLETPLYLMGRFREIYKYCDLHGIKRPVIFFGEVGHDKVWDVPDSLYGPDVGGIRTCERLWRSWGHENWGAYGGVEMQAAHHAIYGPYSSTIAGFCYYQYSEDENNWKEWNIRYVPNFLSATERGFIRMFEPQAVTPLKKQEPAELGLHTLETSETHINLRTLQGGDDGDILNGNEVEVLSNTITNININGTLWACQQVKFGSKTGYVALTGTYKLNPIVRGRDFVGEMRHLLDQYESHLRSTGRW